MGRPRHPPDFKALFEAASGPCLVLEPVGRFAVVAASDAYLRAAETRREQVVGRGLFEALASDPDVADADGERDLRASLERALRERRPDAASARKRTVRRGDDAEERWWQRVNSPLLAPDGGVAWLIHRVEDVTNRVRLAEVDAALQRAVEERRVFSALLDNSSDFIGIADATGRPVYVNPAGRRMVGLAADFPVGDTQISEYYPPELRAFVNDEVVRSMRERGHWKGETFFRHWQTQEAIAVSDEHFLIRDPETGKVLGMGTITRDITDLRRKRDEAEAVARELRRANEEVTRLYERSRELDELRTRFFANVSHELRTPLALIVGPVEHLLASESTSPEARRELEVVRRNALTMLRHVDDLLDIAKLDADRMRAEYADVDVASLARFTAGHFTELAEERRVALTVDAPGSLRAEVDPEKLRRILQNLLSNAFKFTPPGGRVRLSLAARDERAVFEVADSGPGVPAERRAEVFERFGQLGEGAAPRRFGGTGLGLAIVRELTTLLRGVVAVDDAPEGGARFTVELPLRAPEGVAVAAESAASTEREVERTAQSIEELHVAPEPEPEPEPELPADGDGSLVLVVEDHPEMRRVIAECLASTGQRVATAVDGVEGLALVEASRPDLVITDVMMPRMDGERLVAELRARPSFASTPIVVLTAKADDELRVRLLRAGADDFLLKPFSAEELYARVHNLLARARAERRLEEVADASAAVSAAVAGLPDAGVNAVLATIALRARLLTGARYAAVGIGTDPATPFDPWIFSGMDEEDAKRIGRRPRPVGVLGLVMSNDHALRLADLRAHPEHRGLPAGHPPMTSFLGVPIRYRGVPIGHLYLADKVGAPEFSDQDQRFVDMLAAGAGAAIETARLYHAAGMERAWLQTVIDQMPEPAVLIDASGRVAAQNRALRAFMFETTALDPFGNPLALDVRRPTGEHLTPEELPHVRALQRGESVLGVELVALAPDGRHVPVLASAAPVRGADGAIVGATMVLQDISALKELERLREEWVSVVAHDLRQPIHAIVLNCDLALGAAVSDPQRQQLGRARASAERLNRMVDDLMDASQIEAHRLRLDRVRADAGQIVRDAVERAPEAVRARLRTPSEPLFVSADPERIEQVIDNLLSNAVKYGAAGAEVEVAVRREGPEVVVSVTNRGPGIPPEEVPLLFERFARTRAVKDGHVPGTGLGLYVSRGLVQAHGGRIWVESVPGDTTSFRFALPLEEAAA